MSSAAVPQRDHETAKDKKTADNTSPALPRANFLCIVKRFMAILLKKGGRRRDMRVTHGVKPRSSRGCHESQAGRKKKSYVLPGKYRGLHQAPNRQNDLSYA